MEKLMQMSASYHVCFDRSRLLNIMKMLTGKQLQRLEKKKKKMAALLEITKLNDKDREAKALKQIVGSFY